jgi:hypothetical protein
MAAPTAPMAGLQQLGQLGQTAAMFTPEGAALAVGKELAPHAPTILMIPLVVLSIILIIIGIIVLSAAQSKTPGVLLLVLGFLLAGGAFVVMVKSQGKKKAL